MRLTHSVEEKIFGERIDRGFKPQVTAWTAIRRNQSSLLTILESCFVFYLYDQLVPNLYSEYLGRLSKYVL
jgi:hypothetical protein